MTRARHEEAVPFHAVPFHAAEDARWMSAAHAIVVALVLGAAAAAIPAFVLLLAGAKGLVPSL
jgi:hypothetical protein